MGEKQVRAVVVGRVQGVYFRASTLAEAKRRGLLGTVKNLPDGSVGIQVRGPEEAVDALLAWAQQGPPAAKVEAVHVTEEELGPALGPFHILY
jgi:acylphosphatase